MANGAREILRRLYAKGLDLHDNATVEEINKDAQEQIDNALTALQGLLPEKKDYYITNTKFEESFGYICPPEVANKIRNQAITDCQKALGEG